MIVSRMYLIGLLATTLFVLHLSSSSPVENDSDEWVIEKCLSNLPYIT